MKHLGIAARLTAFAILAVASFTACGNHTTGVVPPSGTTSPDGKSRAKQIVVTICEVDPAYCACQADPACSGSPSPTPSPSTSTPPICASAAARRSTTGNTRSKSDCTVGLPSPTPSPTPLIEIDDAVSGAKLSGASTKIVIGKHAQLRVKVVQPPGGALSEIQWNVQGQTVKSYAAPTSSAIQLLSTADTVAPQIAFYWIAGSAQPVPVTIQAKVNGATVQSEADFRVDTPAPTMTSTTERVRVGHTAFYPLSEALSFGIGYMGNPGIKFRFTAHAPDNGAGQIAGLQLINLTSCEQLRIDTPETCSGTQGRYDVDNQFFYDGTVGIAANRDATWSSDDTPQGRLTGRPAAVVRRNDRFHTYLMYRPNGNDSIWVALGRLDWGWSGAAHRIGELPDEGDEDDPLQRQRHHWAGPFGAQWTTNPAGAASNDLPQWTAIFVNG